MLTAVFDRLTALTSKYFIVSAFVPVLAFAFLNGLLAYANSGSFRARVNGQTTTTRAFDAIVFIIGAAVVAYVVWSLAGFFRQVLEGQRLRRTSFVSRKLTGAQLERRTRLREDYAEARGCAAEIGQKIKQWRDSLIAAADEGAKKSPGKNTYGPDATALRRLRERQRRAEAPSVADLDHAVQELSDALRENDIGVAHNGTNRHTLKEDRSELYRLIDRAQDEWNFRELTLATRLQSRFGAEAIAATAFGNVGESLRSYALTRYRMNLETFWSRFQPLLQRHKDFYGALQDAKVQLDFLVSCLLLSALTTVVWVVALPFGTASPLIFLAVALLGPLITWMFYLAAVENYVAFGETVRTSIDLYRLEVLDALHVRQPSGLRDERVLWNALQQVSSFGEAWLDIGYRHDSDSA
jgi:hypothetical protein